VKEKEIFVETEEKVVRDRPIKSLLKAISWRIVGSIDTFLLSYFLIKYIQPGAQHSAVKTAGWIATVEVATKITLYYFHERAWAHMRWGRMMVVLRRNSRRSKKTFKSFLFWR
jgi:uncharacterized membrane protein